MTRAAREQRAAAAARRGEVEWAVMAYVNLYRLAQAGEEAGLAPVTRTSLDKFLRQCPPTVRLPAEGVMASQEQERQRRPARMAAEATQVPDSEARTPDHYPGRGGW